MWGSIRECANQALVWRSMAASANAVAATRAPCWSRRPGLPPKRQARCGRFSCVSEPDVVTRSQLSPWHASSPCSAGICSARMPTTNGRVRRWLPVRSARCSCRLASRREKAISVAPPTPTTSRNYAIGRSMSRVTLNMPTNSSSADGSRVVLKNGARVPPMRSDDDGCAAGLASSRPALCHAVARAPPKWQIQQKRLVDLIRCTDLLPVDVGKGIVRQRLVNSLLDEIGRLAHLAGAQFGDDCIGLFFGSVPAFLRMNGLKHMANFPNLGRGDMAKDVPVEMHDTPLPASL